MGKNDNSSKNDLAEDRTKWAEDRTILANERTFNSWMGTGLASIGVAIGLKAVFGATDPTWAAKVVASIFLAAALIIFWMARRQAYKTLHRLSNNDAEAMPSKNFSVIATVLAIATLAVGAILWSL